MRPAGAQRIQRLTEVLPGHGEAIEKQELGSFISAPAAIGTTSNENSTRTWLFGGARGL
jgi:hypothetical protein